MGGAVVYLTFFYFRILSYPMGKNLWMCVCVRVSVCVCDHGCPGLCVDFHF